MKHINESIIGKKGDYKTIHNHDIVRIVEIRNNRELGLYRVLMDDRELDLLSDFWGGNETFVNPTFCNNKEILSMTFYPESLKIGYNRYEITEIYRCAGEEDIYYPAISVINMQRDKNILQNSITDRHYKLIWKNGHMEK